MKTFKLHSPKFLKKRKLLLLLPLLAVPCLYAAFYFLGGGRAAKKEEAAHTMGFNMELPKALFDDKQDKMTKFDFYKRADEDSLRKRAAMQQDPYQRVTEPVQPLAGKATGSGVHAGMVAGSWPSQDVRVSQDVRADELLKKLDQLKQAMQKTPSHAVDPLPGGA